MSEPDWAEREADMALIRRVLDLMRVAAEAASPDGAAGARAKVQDLMPEYAAASRRHNTAQKRALVRRLIYGGADVH